MLKADTLSELCSLMDKAGPGQLIALSPKLFKKFAHDSTIETIYCNNRDEAQALANFLWNERERHIKDIYAITDDLTLLESKWDVKPTRVKIFIKP